jgi:hypothetical protein
LIVFQRNNSTVAMLNASELIQRNVQQRFGNFAANKEGFDSNNSTQITPLNELILNKKFLEVEFFFKKRFCGFLPLIH